MKTNHELHIELWDGVAKLIAQNGGIYTHTALERLKAQVIAEKHLSSRAIDNCFACTEAFERSKKKAVFLTFPYRVCDYCPLDWKNGNHCTASNTDYTRLHLMTSVSQKVETAERIRDMEWR